MPSEKQDLAQAWLDKYYGKPDFWDMTELELIEHALTKWQGLRRNILAQHSLFLNFYGVVGFYQNEKFHKILRIAGGTCSLCHRYKCETHNDNTHYKQCPLEKFLNAPCDKTDRPYEFWLRTLWYGVNNPEPMIVALQGLLDKTKQERKESSDQENHPRKTL